MTQTVPSPARPSAGPGPVLELAGVVKQYRGDPPVVALARESLELVGLGHRLRHRPNQLSGGERQRTAIARALVGRPALVMADEPTGNLDTAAGASILDLLHELHRAGTTILVITHDRDVAAAMERRIEIRDGRIVRDTRAGS